MNSLEDLMGYAQQEEEEARYAAENDPLSLLGLGGEEGGEYGPVDVGSSGFADESMAGPGLMEQPPMEEPMGAEEAPEVNMQDYLRDTLQQKQQKREQASKAVQMQAQELNKSGY